MLIKAPEYIIKLALAKANEKFDNNLLFNRFDCATKTYPSYNVTLRVRSSKGPGHRMSAPNARSKQHRLVAACWHAHGAFLDALPVGTEVHTSGKVIHAGDPWEDFKMGRRMFPCHLSELCECDE